MENICRVDRGQLSHFLFEDFRIFRVWFLGRLWYAKISSELLATIKQYQISFNITLWLLMNYGYPNSIKK